VFVVDLEEGRQSLEHGCGLVSGEILDVRFAGGSSSSLTQADESILTR
jgi:hypothetical protein